MASINEKNLALGDKSKFQLILVGHDRDEAGNDAYVKKINFPAVKLKGREEVKGLIKTGETGYIPNLVLMTPDGEMVTNDRAKVLAKLNELVEG